MTPIEDAKYHYDTLDYETAFKKFEALAAKEDEEAQYMLGTMHYEGKYLPQNYVCAHMWFNLATANGHEDAGIMRETVAEKMGTNQIEKAQELALNFKKKTIKGKKTRSFPQSKLIKRD